MESEPLNAMARSIKIECERIADFLIEKNQSYGNSVQDSVSIFSKADWKERIKVRLDDKLSRLAHGHEYPGDDTRTDIIGYLVLWRVLDNLDDLNNEAEAREKEAARKVFYEQMVVK